MHNIIDEELLLGKSHKEKNNNNNILYLLCHALKQIFVNIHLYVTEDKTKGQYV